MKTTSTNGKTASKKGFDIESLLLSIKIISINYTSWLSVEKKKFKQILKFYNYEKKYLQYFISACVLFMYKASWWF